MDFVTILTIYISTIVIAKGISLYTISKMISFITKKNYMINPNFDNFSKIKEIASKYNLNSYSKSSYFFPFVNIIGANSFNSNYKRNSSKFIKDLYSIGFLEEISYYAKRKYISSPHIITILKTYKRIKMAQVIELMDGKLYYDINNNYITVLNVTGNGRMLTPEKQRAIITKAIKNKSFDACNCNYIFIDKTFKELSMKEDNYADSKINYLNNVRKSEIVFKFTDGLIVFAFQNGDINIINSLGKAQELSILMQYKIIMKIIAVIIKEDIKCHKQDIYDNNLFNGLIKNINKNIISINCSIASLNTIIVTKQEEMEDNEVLEPISINSPLKRIKKPSNNKKSSY